MWQSTWFHVKEISISDHVDSTLQLHRITLTQSSDLSSKRFLEENILLNHKMEAGVSAIWNSQFRSCVDLTLKQHRKIHVEKSSIFHRFWKSNRREVIHVESMSSFWREFVISTRLDHGDIIFDHIHNKSFLNTSIQYNASLTILGTLRGTTKEKAH